MAEGRGGVVGEFLDHTTPSARTNEASRLFLIVQPPLLLLRRGAPIAATFKDNKIRLDLGDRTGNISKSVLTY